MSQIDYLSEKGAETLARRVRGYWLRLGYVVETWVEPVGISAAWTVKSDLINGMPQGGKVKGIAA